MTDPIIRLLIVEDDLEREKRLLSWLPDGVRAVVARTAGAAIGILQRDRGSVYAGLVLDHDLYTRPMSDTDQFLSGSDIIDSINSSCSRNTPIFVHSNNATQRAAMVQSLRRAGFDVTQIPMDDLSESSFRIWLEETLRVWHEAE